MEEVADGIYSATGEITDTVEDLTGSIVTEMETVADGIHGATTDLSESVTNGMDDIAASTDNVVSNMADGVISQRGEMEQAMGDVINTTISLVNKQLEISGTTSRVFWKVGTATMQGMAGGIREASRYPERELRTIIDRLKNQMVNGARSIMHSLSYGIQAYSRTPEIALRQVTSRLQNQAFQARNTIINRTLNFNNVVNSPMTLATVEAMVNRVITRSF